MKMMSKAELNLVKGGMDQYSKCKGPVATSGKSGKKETKTEEVK